MRATGRVQPYRSADPDTARIWWSDTGVHQNLTFPCAPRSISGMHFWRRAVRVRPAEPGDMHGDIAVNTAPARGVYRTWMARTRPAGQRLHRRHPPPTLLMRPLKPTTSAYTLPLKPDRHVS